jgi:hypothetical protein
MGDNSYKKVGEIRTTATLMNDSKLKKKKKQ